MNSAARIEICVVGSVNLDIVATGERLPGPGETVSGATLSKIPGGKGANQALAARRLGADVRLFGRVGADPEADAALALLRADGVDLAGVAIDQNASTGVALIGVDAAGENQIIVAPGANAQLSVADLDTGGLREGRIVMSQLETPLATIAAAATRARFFCLNAAPAASLEEDLLRAIDLLIVNEHEAAFYGDAALALPRRVAITYGAKGAGLFESGAEVARVTPPTVEAVDTTGAGDAFCAGLVVALAEEMAPHDALRFGCATGAAAASAAGAQTSLASRDAVERLL